MTATETPTIDSTIGELVAARPGWSRVFEKLGIDYCCGGKRPLREVCAEKGIDAAVVLQVLLASDAVTPQEPERNWTSASLTALADHVEQTHHAYLKRELPRLGAMVRKVAAVHGANHPWLLEVNDIYARFAAEMFSHMDKEEQGLFPMIRALEKGQAPRGECGSGVGNPVRVMEHEHDDAGQAMERMRRLSGNYEAPADACNTFRAMLAGLAEVEADTHRHVHKENSILFPRALELEKRMAS